jgi:integrase
MHEILVPLLTALKARGGMVFHTSRDVPYEPHDEDELNPRGGQMKSSIIGARKRSGIPEIAPYTGRHTVSTQLVLNGVHPFIKDQIMGHVKTDMSHNYTHIPQPPLIEAIRTLPVIEEWAAAPWLHDPLAWQRKLAAGTGKRNDLIRRVA